MTFPVYLRLGPFVLHPHAAFEILGYAAGVWCYLQGRRNQGDVIPTESRVWVVIAAVLGGLIGARLMYLVEHVAEFADAWHEASFLLGGKSIVGGLLGGLIAVEWTKRRMGVTMATGDLLALPLTLGIAIGRVGCFLSGLPDQTYGVATGLPWGVDFGDGVPRHPTQLYEIVFLVALGALLVTRGDHMVTSGDRFKVFMLTYLSFRLAVDALKPGIEFVGLSPIQWACLAAILYYAPHLPRLTSELRHG